MPGPLPPDSQRSAVGVIRHWLTRTIAGPTLLAGLSLKLITTVARFSWRSTASVEAVDTLADIALLAGALLLIGRLFIDPRGGFLWRVRRKLILSYIFIGFVPVLLALVFFPVAGLILFLSVGQYVALGRINAVVEQTAFLAESAAIGLQGAGTLDEVRARLERRQAGAVRSFPYVSYAIVPAHRSCGGSLHPDDPWPPSLVTAGLWQHLDPPTRVPDWIGASSRVGMTTPPTPGFDPLGGCPGTSQLVAYTVPQSGSRSADTAIQIVARAVAWPDSSAPRDAVGVDVPVGAALREKMWAETGIEVGGLSPTNCPGPPLSGRDVEPDKTITAHDATGASSLLRGANDWVAFPSYVVWETGDECVASMRIRMTLAELYARVSATPLRIDEGLLGILALVGVLFLLIQIAAFVMGLALARSITRSVHELFTGTERVRQADFTHKIPITSQDQLGELAESFNSMTASIADLLEEKAEKERMEQELRIARSIQLSLLPREQLTLPGVTLIGHCEPAREVGGDYYDYMRLDDGRLAMLIADVAGKGTSAALYMAELKGLILSLSQLHTSPRQLLIDANRIIYRHLDSKSFITITYAVVDPQARTLTYARAGHCPLIYVPGSYAPSRAAQILAPDGLVLGLQIDDEGRRFIGLLEEVTMPLGAGDVVLFYTDGLTEAMDREGACFGDARLAAIVQEHADAPFDELRDQIFSEVTTFAGPVAQQDDMTMLLMRFQGAEAQVAVAAGSA